MTEVSFHSVTMEDVIPEEIEFIPVNFRVVISIADQERCRVFINNKRISPSSSSSKLDDTNQAVPPLKIKKHKLNHSVSSASSTESPENDDDDHCKPLKKRRRVINFLDQTEQQEESDVSDEGYDFEKKDSGEKIDRSYKDTPSYDPNKRATEWEVS